MAFTKLSYQRLEKIPTGIEEEEGGEEAEEESLVVSRSRISLWRRLIRRAYNGRRRWRRPTRVKILGLRRLLRRKAWVVGAKVRVSLGRILKRLKEGGPHMGELFAGNYMFMQVSPSPTLGCLDKSFMVGPNDHHHLAIPTPPSTRCNLPRVVS